MSNIPRTSTKTSKTRPSAKLFACAVGLSTAQAFAGAQVDTALLGEVDFGIICPAGTIEKIPATGTTLGYISQRQAAQQIEVTTQIIPLIKGTGFGVRTTNIAGQRLVPVQITVTHPVFPGHGSTSDVWIDSFEIDSVNFNFFTFEFPFEMQTGSWSFSASRFDQLLYSVEFDIVDPETVPHLTGICAEPPLTS